MSAIAAAGESIAVASLPNLRDIGGWPVRDGRVVRRGLVYRSVALNHLTDGDPAAVEARGLRTVWTCAARRSGRPSPTERWMASSA
jgi:protein-tyrosine phosphatase